MTEQAEQTPTELSAQIDQRHEALQEEYELENGELAILVQQRRIVTRRYSRLARDGFETEGRLKFGCVRDELMALQGEIRARRAVIESLRKELDIA